MQELQETRFNPWVRKSPQRRKWQFIPMFLPAQSHGLREDYRGAWRATTEQLSTQSHGLKAKWWSSASDFNFTLSTISLNSCGLHPHLSESFQPGSIHCSKFAITSTWLHWFTQYIYSCQVFGDLAALHQGFERRCDRVTFWNTRPSQLPRQLFPLSHSLPFISTSSKPKSTHKSFFFHRLFYSHPGPSGSHLFPNDFKKQFFQTHPGLSAEEHLANHGFFPSNHNYMFFIFSFQSVILFQFFLLENNQTCNKQMICGKFNLLKRGRNEMWLPMCYRLKKLIKVQPQQPGCSEENPIGENNG